MFLVHRRHSDGYRNMYVDVDRREPRPSQNKHDEIYDVVCPAVCEWINAIHVVSYEMIMSKGYGPAFLFQNL